MKIAYRKIIMDLVQMSVLGNVLNQVAGANGVL